MEMNGLQDTGDYIKGLYVPSTWNPPLIHDGNLELRMADFATRLDIANKHASQCHRRTNLTPQQYAVLHAIRSDQRFIICLTDKNLGPAIIECNEYIKRVFADHLDDASTYQRLTTAQATDMLEATQTRFKHLLHQHKDLLSPAEQVYFQRSLQCEHRIPQFYLTLKVHKTPWKTRPVVACVGSFAEVFSKWLDHQMKRLLPLSNTYLRDSNQVLDELTALGALPPNAKLFTADAVSMYTNIDTEHAISTFRRWLTDFTTEIPDNFPTELFLRVLELVMTRNIFQFDDTYWLQTDGTAMGTSAACMYAMLYYAYHERQSILPTHGRNLLYFKRFIDDVLGVWIGNATDEWDSFQSLLAFGSLQWETSDPSDTAIFLDLEISINPDTHRIATKTYQKPMNLFLYIPPTSAHPPGVLKSIVLGNLQRFW